MCFFFSHEDVLSIISLSENIKRALSEWEQLCSPSSHWGGPMQWESTHFKTWPFIITDTFGQDEEGRKGQQWVGKEAADRHATCRATEESVTKEPISGSQAKSIRNRDTPLVPSFILERRIHPHHTLHKPGLKINSISSFLWPSTS